jgi:uncharacterized protein involved in exopolysaccharide biosynthesis
MDNPQLSNNARPDPPPVAPRAGERRGMAGAGRRADDWKRLTPESADALRWSLRDLYRALFRYKKRACAFFVAVMAAAAIGLVFCPRKYKSDAELFVRVGRESVALDPTVTTGTSTTVGGLSLTRDAEINSIIEVMSSRGLIERVAQQVGLVEPDQDDLQRDKAIARLAKRISISSPKKTNVVAVSCQAESPQRAQQVVQTLVDNYLQEHLRLNSTAGSHGFFDAQAKLLKQQLDEAAAELRDTKSRFNLASIEGRRDTLQQQIAAVGTETLQTESAIAAADARLKELRATLDKLPAAAVRDIAAAHGTTTASGLRQKLFELEAREKELLSKYTEQHPAVIAIRREVADVTRILSTELPDRDQATSAAMLNEQANHKSLQARAQALREQSERLRGELGTLNEQEVKVNELERRVKVAEANFLAYQSSLEQVRVNEALKKNAISNINVIQPASLVLEPVSPKKGLTLAMALVAAVSGALTLVLISERLDHSLKTPEDLEKYLGLPLLTSIPRVRSAQLAWKGPE